MNLDKTTYTPAPAPVPASQLQKIDIDQSIIDLDGIALEPSIVFTLPGQVALRRQILPCCELDEEILIACALLDPSLKDQLTRYFKKPLHFFLVPAEQLRQKISYCYSPLLKRQGATGDQAEATALSSEILHAALIRGASDIHIDPKSEATQVRFRVNGQLELYKELPSSMHPMLSSRIKVLSGMDIAEKRSPQDGKFQHPHPDGSFIDVRSATIPARKGEKLTLRLIGVGAHLEKLEDLGMQKIQQEALAKVLAQPHGIIIIGGATGSGKTTTLYTCLEHLIRQGDYNIITIEDPVEYQLEEANQVEIDGEKITFASALRSVLRHDPDIVMLGEIRDLETANIALRASMTGHLVLSTVHANTACGIISRLEDMGIEPYLLASTLRLSLVQTLVPKLCRHCREKVILPAEEALALNRLELEGRQFYSSKGCLRCSGRGITGRIALFELLPIDNSWSRLISSGASQDTLMGVMREKNLQSLFDDALSKAELGLIDHRLLHDFIKID